MGLNEASKIAARLALSISAGRMAIWDYDLAADQLTGSPELFQLLGFPIDANPTTEEIRSRYFPGERERLQAEGRAAIARGEQFVESEFRYLWPDGSVRWVLLRAQALSDGTGRPVRAIGVVMDITQRKDAEEARRINETRLKLAQDIAELGVWDWDLRTRIATWSPEIFALLGLDAERVDPSLYATWVRAIHPEDRAAAAKVIRDARRNLKAFSIDFRLRSRLGAAPRWIRSRGSPVAGDDGMVSRFVGVNIDVSAEHWREERLVTLADDLRATAANAERARERIADLSNDLFAVIGPSGVVKAFNPAWNRVLDPERDYRGIPFLDLVSPEDRSFVAADLSKVRHTNELHRFEARHRRADNSTVCAAWTVSANDEVVYALGRDITAEKILEASKVQTQKMEALGQLTGGIAHDFNNLLQGVNGYLELIQRSPTHTKVIHWAENALLASERGTKLTAQLLGFSRSQGIEVAPVPVGATLTGLSDLLDRILGSSVRVTVDLPPEPLSVMADRTQLETAFLNLAINARDAMPDGGKITISALPVSSPLNRHLPTGDYVELRVSDTGSGMPPSVVSRAFDPFFTTKGVGKGTGLGLSQVYGMTRHAGGAATIESRPGEGTTVSMLLRRGPSVVEVGPEADGLSGLAMKAGTKVLVVDDDADVRSFLADCLAVLGYDATFAMNGPTALAALEREIPDVVLMDFAMPGMNGAEVAREARARHPGLVIVFASGHADSAQIDDAIGPGTLRLRKPFHMRDLAQTLTSLLA